MNFIYLGRQEGKTTKVLEWLREAPPDEHRVVVVMSLREAERLYLETLDKDGNETYAVEEQFVTLDYIPRRKMGQRANTVYAVDNADLILQSLLNGNMVMATWTKDD